MNLGLGMKTEARIRFGERQHLLADAHLSLCQFVHAPQGSARFHRVAARPSSCGQCLAAGFIEGKYVRGACELQAKRTHKGKIAHTIAVVAPTRLKIRDCAFRL